MGYNPDEYAAACIEEAGPSPWLTFVNGALDLYRAGFGSKSQAALDARSKMGACIVALNGHPLAFYGGMTRDESQRFPGDDRATIPDAMEVLARKLSGPDLSRVVDAAFAVLEAYGPVNGPLRELSEALDVAFPDDLGAITEDDDDSDNPRQIAVWQDGGEWFWDTLDSGVQGESEPFGPFHSRDHGESNARDYYAMVGGLARPVKFSEGLPEAYPADWRDLLDGYDQSVIDMARDHLKGA